MIAAVRAEIRKLCTVRSTYYACILAFLVATFFAGFIEGWHADPKSLLSAGALASDITGTISVVSIFAGLIALLLMANEYRYNTIAYTLTSNNSRSQVLAAKIIAMSCFAVVFALVIGAYAPLAAWAGIHVHHLSLVQQTFDWFNLLWRCLLFTWGSAMLSLIIVTFVRNQVAAIVILFIVPGTVESLLSLLLKKNAAYLPFSAHNAITSTFNEYSISPGRAALVFTAYVVVAWAIAWFTFLRRDAN